MEKQASKALSVGDRSQGYEVTGQGSIDGLGADYRGLDTRDANADVTLLHLADDQDHSDLFATLRSLEALGSQTALVLPRTIVRFGSGSAVVIGKEQGGRLVGQTFVNWIEHRKHVLVLEDPRPLIVPNTTRMFMPIIDALADMHALGVAHGTISAVSLFSGVEGSPRLFGPWRMAGADAEDAYTMARAPELIAGDQPTPVSDIYSLASLIYWAILADPAPRADHRMESRAKHDADPYVPLADHPWLASHEGQKFADLIDSAMRLHPAMRPQSMVQFRDQLASILDTQTGSSAPASPWRSTGSASQSSLGTNPPPLPPARTKGARVPPIPKVVRTSKIGEAPPPLPDGQGKQVRSKRTFGPGSVIGFIVALAVAWYVASGGMFSDNDNEPQTAPTNQTTQDRTPVEPRKGPRTQTTEQTRQEQETLADGVLDQFCNSRLTFETAREDGIDALTDYFVRCQSIDSRYVEQAREILGVNN